MLLAAVAAAPAAARAAAAPTRVEVVVSLDIPSVAQAVSQSRALTSRVKARRLDLASPTSVAQLRAIAGSQRTVASRIVHTFPTARIRWRYSVVFSGLAVFLPAADVGRLASVPGVRAVYPSVTYRAQLDRSPELIGADKLWGLPQFTTAGQGVKIGIVDDGVDQSHPFFNPAGYTYPPGFPKGQTAFTTPKVIAARAFAPPTTTWKFASRPFDPEQSDHATHVAGIAAGDYTIGAVQGRGPLSGVAPRAYLGNYKALSVPTDQFGLNGNAPEIAAAIEAAVKDGMDVINLSLGEPEIEPRRDLVVAALNGAAAAGVVVTVAAGNEADSLGRGSVTSPGSAAGAVTVAAVTKSDVIAGFSSIGPTPISLQLKPDVSAPGVSILSSVPNRVGTWVPFSGTSMAAPHVAGAAALLRQRHPSWTVAQIKSALAQTGDPVLAEPGRSTEISTISEGGGLVNLVRADNPLIFASPVGLTFGLLRAGATSARTIALTDAGGGSGDWTVTVEPQEAVAGLTVAATPSTVIVPGAVTVTATAAADATEADATGFVVLRRGADKRRVAYWLRVERPRLPVPSTTLAKPGVYSGNTRGRPSRVSSYRYPDEPEGSGVSNHLTGPEQVFRVRITRPVANIGVVLISKTPGVTVTPRIVVAGDENRLQGTPALPLAVNPYLFTYGRLEPVAGVLRPSAGVYYVVFETPSPSRAGPFKFRLWMDDLTPPVLKIATPVVRDGRLVVSVVDPGGSGLDPAALQAIVDGELGGASYSAATGRIVVRLGSETPGRHRIEIRASDYQEAKNNEDVTAILPNTRVFRGTFRVAG